MVTRKDSYPQLLSLAFMSPDAVSVVGAIPMRVAGGHDSERQRVGTRRGETRAASGRAGCRDERHLKLDAGLIAFARQPLDPFALVGDVAGLCRRPGSRVHLASPRRTGGARRRDATRLRSAFDAIFRADSAREAWSSTVIADRRPESRGGARRPAGCRHATMRPRATNARRSTKSARLRLSADTRHRRHGGHLVARTRAEPADRAAAKARRLSPPGHGVTVEEVYVTIVDDDSACNLCARFS